MSYGEKSGGFPPLPASLNANPNAWEMVDLGHGSHQAGLSRPSRPCPDTDPIVTPYLGLRARLSQLWFNRWTVLLLLVLVRVIILTGSLNEDLGDAKDKALSACTKVEDIGSAMASMPHYLSVGVNSLAIDGINNAVSGMVEMLKMVVNGVKHLLLFIVNYYIGTYACLIIAFIKGGLSIAVDVVDAAAKEMNDFLGPVTDELANDVSGFKDKLNQFIDKINLGTGGVLPSMPSLDIGAPLDRLKDFKFDSADFVKDLQQLNQSIPTFDEAEKAASDALQIPFDMVRDQITKAYGNYSFDGSAFPVAKKQALKFCSSNSFLNDFFTKLFEIVAKAKIAFIVVIIVLAILAMFVVGYLEIRRWRREKDRARTFTERGYDPMDVVYMASRPFTAGVGVKIASKFRSNERRYLLVRWAIAYGTSLPALFVLSLAIAGFFSCLCQYILLQSIEKEAPALANQVGDFAGSVVHTLEDVSTSWADNANKVVLGLQDDINHDLLGWVGQATSAVNDTLNTLEEDIDTAVKSAFNGTILLGAVQTVINCIITRKLDTIEQGLTWVHDQARITLPLFPNDTFSQGAQASVQGDGDLTSFLASPASVTTDEVSGAVEKVVATLRSSIIQEALVSTALFLVYIIVVLMGVMRSLFSMAIGREKTRAEGGHRYNITHPMHDVLHHRRPPPPPPTQPHQPAEEEASPAYNDVIYASGVPRGKTELKSSTHAHKSSYPEWDDDGYHRHAR